jgi:putative flavoprotein involved in K+ transport
MSEKLVTEVPAIVSQGSDPSSDRLDAAVIGAGQAGLAMGYLLAQQGGHFAILDSAPTIGAAWRARWDSLKLFTPRRYDSLPGLEFPGDANGYPTRDEVIEYLERYAETFELAIALDNGVQSLSFSDDGFVLELEDGSSIEADQVIVATGPFQVPRVPTFAADLAPEIIQKHSTGYSRPSDLPEGTVLVVGGGNTGFQIAEELAATHEVHLAVGSRQLPLPQRFLGRDLFWWLEKIGLLHKTVDSRLGRRMRDRDTLIGSSPRSARRAGVHMKPRAVGVSGRTVSFADGSTLDVDAVIWATGYRFDHSWIEPPVADEDGTLRHRRGVTDVRGLYFLGLPWQHTRGSALLGWVKDDAEFIANEIATSTKDRTSLVREGELAHAN